MPKIRVLLVEDDAAYAGLVEAALATSEIEFDVHTSARLSEALTTLGKQAFNLVLLDLNLPDSSGLPTVEAIVAASNVPIIVLSGLEDEAVASLALASGAQRFLRKNEMSTSSLIGAMRHAVSLHRKLQSGGGATESTAQVFEELSDSAAKLDVALTELEQLQLAPDKSQALTSARTYLNKMNAAISRYLSG